MRTVSTKSLTLSAAVYKCVTTKWNPCATSSIKVSGQRRVHEMHEGHLWTVVIGTNLSDQGIHWLCPKSKTGDMQFEESKSWATSKRVIFITVWKFPAMLRYVNKSSLPSQKLIWANMQKILKLQEFFEAVMSPMFAVANRNASLMAKIRPRKIRGQKGRSLGQPRQSLRAIWPSGLLWIPALWSASSGWLP